MPYPRLLLPLTLPISSPPRQKPKTKQEDEEDDRRYNRSPSPRRRRRSPSPYSQRRRRSYSRSRSPPRRSKDAFSKKSTTGGGGFKWKDPNTTTANAEPSASGAEKKGLDRGYSSHYTHQPARPKSPSPERDDLASKFGTGYSARYNRPTTTTSTADGDAAAKFGTSTIATAADGAGDDDERRRRKREKKEQKAREGPTPVSGPMIVVNVNDRLGTKVAVPCLASDPIRLFKAQVAARVGRQPHEIMLKRQGERPFRDGLTLEDYGVSNGVQLDLEVDTGE
ncbi:MAG: hypothetical protein OHK93_006746 [Ramalina farinacea]|uniref:Ubiquitin-like modifier HUB1 n=1 Tax=Ramalina farinacea TaxID=258253 RepID=A0AA43QJ52_9LECA|nr:hypothetical protein [Ramalina farinacea]